ncbi:MAG: hypothetical protein NTW21_23270 [Verrucomicrobia bacterium]|nr:hypothetical protein [Verrucomicrobiota bacterium]
MNTKLDETTLARWLDDELQGAELAAVEVSIQGDEALLTRRRELREWRATIGAVIPAVREPLYPEFFNSRIERAIREQAPTRSWLSWLPSQAAAWRAWWMPATALAGMALAFWVGTKTGGMTQVPAVPKAVPVPVVVQVPTVYTPERGVAAEWFSSPDAAATVIVLEGVEAIPDTLDFSETAALPGDREFTARLASPANGELLQ